MGVEHEPVVPGDLEVLAAWAPELADPFVALACDIALVVDGDGRIATLAQHEAQPIAPPVGDVEIRPIQPPKAPLEMAWRVIRALVV